MALQLDRIEIAIARAAYPDFHPDFTDAVWRRMVNRMAVAVIDMVLEEQVGRDQRVRNVAYEKAAKVADAEADAEADAVNGKNADRYFARQDKIAHKQSKRIAAAIRAL